MKIAGWILSIAILLYLAALVALAWTQRSMLYFPMRETMSPFDAGLSQS